MWMLLLACSPPSPSPGGSAPEPSRGPDAREVTPLPLPAELPFTARTRVVPVTLVDRHGAVLLVLDALGVELEVQRVLADRALVRCTGCRAEVEAWVQNSALFVGVEAGAGPDDDLLAWLNRDADDAVRTLARNGLTRPPRARKGTPWFGPPWHDEGGYVGPVLTVRPSASGWSASIDSPTPPVE